MSDEGLYVGMGRHTNNTPAVHPARWLVEFGWDEWLSDRSRRRETPNNATTTQASCVRLPRWVRRGSAAKPGTADLRRSLKALRNTVEAEVRTGCVVFLLAEFPHSFAYTVENRLWLDRVLGELEGLPLVVGFWSDEWYTSRLIEGLKQRNAALCLYDAPRVPGLPPAVEVLTADRVYARFLGRNEMAWKSGQFRHVFDYRYTKKELATVVPRLSMWRREAEVVAVVFANGRWAAESAALMDRLLSVHVGIELPEGGGP